MTLKVTTEPREERQLAVKIEVPQERVDQELRKAAAKVAAEYRLPGFRKGKAPYHIVVQQFGVANLYGEFVDKLGEEVYKEALAQEDIQPYAMAALEDVALDPLVYTLIVPLEPVVDLGDYRAMRVERDEILLDEAKVDAQLEAYRGSFAAWQAIDGPSAYGDMLTIDVKSVIAAAAEGDEPIVVLDETDWDVTPDEENPMDPPGFDEALLGMTAGESKEFNLSWPAESRSIHAGKEAAFTVTVKQIQRYENPALDDAFAVRADPEVQTLEELRTKVRDKLKAEMFAAADDEYSTKAIDALAEMASLDYPPAVIEDQLDSMMRDYERQLQQVGIEDLAHFFDQTGQKVEDFRASLRPQATISARRNLVLSEIIRVEQLEVTDEDIEARIGEMTQVSVELDEEAMAQVESMAAVLRSATGRVFITNDLVREKAVERVIAIARGDELPELSPTPEPAAAVVEDGVSEEAEAVEATTVIEESAEHAVEASAGDAVE